MADEEETPIQTFARELQGTDKAVMTLNDRVSQVESRLMAYGIPEVQGEYSIPDGEPITAVSALVERISQVEEGAALREDMLVALDRLSALEEKVRRIDGAAALELSDRIGDLARRITGETQRINEIREMVHSINDRLQNVEGVESEFSLPIGRGVPRFGNERRLPMTAGDIITREGIERKAYNQGYVEGQNSMLEPKGQIEWKAIDEAAQRVRQYMMGSFSEATIAGVVRALVASSKPRPIRDNPQA